MSTPPNPYIVSEPQAIRPEPQADWLHAVQCTMAQWFELQAAQNRVLERFLEMQERLAFGTATSGLPLPARTMIAPMPFPMPVALPRPAVPVAIRPAVPVPQEPTLAPPPRVAVPAAPRAIEPARAAAPVAAPPAPVAAPVNVAPAPVAAPAPAASAPVAAQPQPKPVEAAPVPAVHATNGSSTNGNGEVPSTDDFRRDLLLAVSNRTGYPVDVLDEDTPLEAGLGIDSIKTVEIFSNLKKYHFYFRAVDEDDEETLLAFSQLKTLRAIVDSYDERSKRFESPHAGNGKPAAENSNGASLHSGDQPTGGTVHRYSLVAVEASDASNGEKKNFPLNS
jgi:hypothetical protein